MGWHRWRGKPSACGVQLIHPNCTSLKEDVRWAGIFNNSFCTAFGCYTASYANSFCPGLIGGVRNFLTTKCGVTTTTTTTTSTSTSLAGSFILYNACTCTAHTHMHARIAQTFPCTHLRYKSHTLHTLLLATTPMMSVTHNASREKKKKKKQYMP